MALTEAYDKTHKDRGGKRTTRKANASKLAKEPDVKALIAKYEPLLTPIKNYDECREEMLANLRRLALGAEDERVQLMATKTLHDICEENAIRVKRRTLPQADAIIGELLQISEPQPVIELETVDAASEAQQATEEAELTELANAGEVEESYEDAEE